MARESVNRDPYTVIREKTLYIRDITHCPHAAATSTTSTSLLLASPHGSSGQYPPRALGRHARAFSARTSRSGMQQNRASIASDSGSGAAAGISTASGTFKGIVADWRADTTTPSPLLRRQIPYARNCRSASTAVRSNAMNAKVSRPIPEMHNDQRLGWESMSSNLSGPLGILIRSDIAVLPH